MAGSPFGYITGKCLHSSRTSELHDAIRELDGTHVLIKSYLDRESIDATARARREFETMARIHAPGVPRALELNLSTEPPLLVMEGAKGSPLERILADGPLDAENWLDIALQAAESLVAIHQAHVLHGDITPGNLLLDPPSRKIRIINFEFATPFDALGDMPVSARIGASLAYIAPEQTGRMNRGCDCRSDLYMLGGTLYHALTGHPPFASQDPLELIHSHIARLPVSPAEGRPDIPRTLSRVVMKLLSKQPEERYQSARALADDLALCRDALARTGTIAEDLPLGASDAPQRPRFLRRLHGREREHAQLKEALERCVRGPSELWILKGPPGAGKSALAAELRSEIGRHGGYLASGKFDLYRHGAPYAGWSSAFQALLHQRLTESPARLAAFRAQLAAGLGALAGVLAELVPDLRLVLGEVPSVPQLESRAVRERLALAVQRFVQACATPRDPLVLFLDDLQWADPASLYLLEELMPVVAPCSLLLIGSYRDSDAESPRTLESSVARLRELGVNCQVVELAPLGDESCAQMLAEALQRSPQDTLSLAHCVSRKTGNLPLLVRQFIEHVHELGLLRFQPGRGWIWDEAGIESARIPEGAVSLLTARIEALTSDARQVLELASCIGDRFDAGLLTEASGRSRACLEPALYDLCNEGLIAPTHGGFQFVHDRIREAAQALLSDEQRARLHHRAGRLLHEALSPTARTERAFELADHFNRATSLLSAAEREMAIELNLTAANRALAAGAAATAQGYLTFGRALFREGDWDSRSALAFDLFLRSATCENQLGNHDECLRLLDVLERRPLPALQLTFATVQRIQAHAMGEAAEHATRLGLAALRRLGIHFPLHPSQFRTYLAIIQFDLALRGKGAERFRPSQGYSPAQLATFLLCLAIGGPATRVDARLAALISAWAGRRILQLGYSRGPQLAMASLAAQMCGLFADGRRAERYGQLAADLNERIRDDVYGYRSQVVLHGQLYPWLRPRVQAVEVLLSIGQTTREMGDREFAMYSSSLRTYTRLLSGVHLVQSEAELAAHHRDFAYEIPWIPLSIQALRSLREERSDDALNSDLERIDAQFEGLGGLSIFVRLPWILALCALGRFADALRQCVLLGEPPTLGSLRADLEFFRGLAAAALARDDPDLNAKKCRRILARSTRRLARWSRHGPDFAHMAELLRAERSALRGTIKLARQRYAAALRRAQQQGYFHHAALAAEREAQLLRRLRRETEAAQLLAQARALYQRWGADAKVEMLRRESDGLLRRVL